MATRYHLKDVIVGKIYFLLVRIKIKTMELAIIRRETTGAGKLEGNRLKLACNCLTMMSSTQSVQ